MRRFRIDENPDFGLRPSASPYITTCLQIGCEFKVTDRSKETAVRGIEIHPCPYYLGKVKVNWMSYGPSLLQQLWDKADEEYKIYVELRVDPPTNAVLLTQGKLQGIAFALSLFMQPHLVTVADVSREVKKRSDMKAAGEEYETPGLGQRIYEAPPGNNKYETRSSAAILLDHGLTPNQVEQIKTFASHFTHEQLAANFKVPVSTIQSILGV